MNRTDGRHFSFSLIRKKKPVNVIQVQSIKHLSAKIKEALYDLLNQTCSSKFCTEKENCNVFDNKGVKKAEQSHSKVFGFHGFMLVRAKNGH